MIICQHFFNDANKKSHYATETFKIKDTWLLPLLSILLASHIVWIAKIEKNTWKDQQGHVLRGI